MSDGDGNSSRIVATPQDTQEGNGGRLSLEEESSASNDQNDVIHVRSSAASKHVHFAPDVLTPAEMMTTTTPATSSKIQLSRARSTPSASSRGGRRQRLGNAKANVLRDVAILLSFLGLLMYVTWDMGPNKGENDNSIIDENQTNQTTIPVRFAQGINKVMDSLMKAVMERSSLTKQQRRKLQQQSSVPPCLLFVRESSIPGMGLSYFAGRDYAVGDIVLFSDVALPVVNLPLEQPFPHVGAMMPLHAWMLKHHPSLANVEGQLLVIPDTAANDDIPLPTNYTLTATRPIAIGEELFVSWQQHPMQQKLQHQLQSPSSPATESEMKALNEWFGVIPVKEDYDWIDSIVTDTFTSTKRIQWTHARTGTGATGSHHSWNVDFVFSLQKRTVAKMPLSPGRYAHAAALLPGSAMAAKKRYNPNTLSLIPSVWSALHNRSLLDLNLHGTCYNDLTTAAAAASTITVDAMDVESSLLSTTSTSTTTEHTHLSDKNAAASARTTTTTTTVSIPNDAMVVVTTRAFHKGDYLGTVPVRVYCVASPPLQPACLTKEDDHKQDLVCPTSRGLQEHYEPLKQLTWQSNCWEAKVLLPDLTDSVTDPSAAMATTSVTAIYFCPLYVPLAQLMQQLSQDLRCNSSSGSSSSDIHLPNVKVQWSLPPLSIIMSDDIGNDAVRVAHAMIVNASLHHASLTWTIVALRDIAANEPLQIKVDDWYKKK